MFMAAYLEVDVLGRLANLDVYGGKTLIEYSILMLLAEWMRE